MFLATFKKWCFFTMMFMFLEVGCSTIQGMDLCLNSTNVSQALETMALLSGVPDECRQITKHVGELLFDLMVLGDIGLYGNIDIGHSCLTDSSLLGIFEILAQSCVCVLSKSCPYHIINTMM